MNTRDIPKGAGEALIEAVRINREQSDRRERFHRWLGGYTLASHIVESLARRPGLRDVPSTMIRDAFQRIARAGNQSYEHLKKRLESRGIVMDDPGYQLQVKRLVYEAVARHWPDDDAEMPDLFTRIPRQGDRATDDFATQIALLNGYISEVIEHIEREGETPPGERSMASDYALDRLLAAHTMYQRLHDGVVPFFNDQISGSDADWQRLLLGPIKAADSAPVATDIVNHLVGAVILPIVDERHGHLLAVFDPDHRFNAADRHIAYRALITNITADAVSALTDQRDDLIREARGFYETGVTDEQTAQATGLLTRWLTGQINYRLNRVYPRPDEYIGGGGI